jgi:hypothetical protein
MKGVQKVINPIPHKPKRCMGPVDSTVYFVDQNGNKPTLRVYSRQGISVNVRFS